MFPTLYRPHECIARLRRLQGRHTDSTETEDEGDHIRHEEQQKFQGKTEGKVEEYVENTADRVYIPQICIIDMGLKISENETDSPFFAQRSVKLESIGIKFQLSKCFRSFTSFRMTFRYFTGIFSRTA